MPKALDSKRGLMNNLEFEYEGWVRLDETKLALFDVVCSKLSFEVLV